MGARDLGIGRFGCKAFVPVGSPTLGLSLPYVCNDLDTVVYVLLLDCDCFDDIDEECDDDECLDAIDCVCPCTVLPILVVVLEVEVLRVVGGGSSPSHRPVVCSALVALPVTTSTITTTRERISE